MIPIRRAAPSNNVIRHIPASTGSNTHTHTACTTWTSIASRRGNRTCASSVFPKCWRNVGVYKYIYISTYTYMAHAWLFDVVGACVCGSIRSAAVFYLVIARTHFFPRAVYDRRCIHFVCLVVDPNPLNRHRRYICHQPPNPSSTYLPIHQQACASSSGRSGWGPSRPPRALKCVLCSVAICLVRVSLCYLWTMIRFSHTNSQGGI